MTCLRELEQKFVEYQTTSGKVFDEDVKVAIVLGCSQHEIRTQLNLQIKHDSTYADLRSVVTTYDSASTNWSGSVPMEVDRIKGYDGPIASPGTWPRQGYKAHLELGNSYM